jgi:soluble lytic murein transglycosylase
VIRLLRLGAVLALVAGGFLYLQRTEPPWWARLWYPLHYKAIVVAHARHYELDPALLSAVIYSESKFRADAESHSGAIGLMQLEPATAKGIAVHTGGSKFVVSDLYNPELNVRYGSWYLHHLLVKYDDDERLALAAYNAGQENVDRWRAAGEDVQFPETRAYVDKVERLQKIYRRTYADQLGYR